MVRPVLRQPQTEKKEVPMQLMLRQSQRLVLRQTLRLRVAMPELQWSLVHAFRSGDGPPPYVPPTFEEEVFAPRLRLTRRQIPDFESLTHVERMRRVDAANAVFRFAYTRGRDLDDGRDKCYFKIPLLRDRSIMENPDGIEGIRIRISRAEYERATAILAAVGEMERIVRAIPYHGLYRAVSHHIRRGHAVSLRDVVLVAVDRGGRIPCLVLQRALGFASMATLKVDQGGGQLDEGRLRTFADPGLLREKHVLFVDSTVDSGRQIRVLERYFDDATWQSRLGHRSWSLVGSNEHAQNLAHHRNVNWGVDPDTTFEDHPDLMGVDYAPGSLTEVVECPSETSEAIRRSILAVPDGWIYDAGDIDEQIASQRREWERRQRERRATHRQAVRAARAEHRDDVAAYRQRRDAERQRNRLERNVARITASPRWQRAIAQQPPEETLPTAVPNGTSHPFHNVLVIGRGQRDLPDASIQFIADQLGPHCSLFAGTPTGNPGAVLHAVLTSAKVPTPEVRLYQPEYARHGTSTPVGGILVTFVGPEKDDMRRQMIADSHVVLALGGHEGTLREALLALEMGKPTVLIDGYGSVPACVLAHARYRKMSNCIHCGSLASAVATILQMPLAA